MTEKDREQPPDESSGDEEIKELADSESLTDEQKAEKRVSDAQRAMHEKAQEASGLRERLARLEGKIEEQGNRREPPPKPDDPVPEYDDPEWAEKIIADPKILADTLRRRDAFFAAKYNEQSAWYAKEIATLKSQLQDYAPEKATLRVKIAEMAKADPEFAKAPKAAQEFIAKRELAASKSKETREYPGGPGGTARVRSEAANNSAWEKEVAKWWGKLGGNNDA